MDIFDAIDAVCLECSRIEIECDHCPVREIYDNLSNEQPPEGWVCSDNDCHQHYIKVNDYRWRFIEIREFHDDGFNEDIVCCSIINLDDYSEKEIRTYCSSFYEDIHEITDIQNISIRNELIAECIFESLMLSECEETKKFPSYTEAKRYANRWMKEYSGK